jgi:hypothetical protein
MNKKYKKLFGEYWGAIIECEDKIAKKIKRDMFYRELVNWLIVCAVGFLLALCLASL